jgi:hypothetical protein
MTSTIDLVVSRLSSADSGTLVAVLAYENLEGFVLLV